MIFDKYKKLFFASTSHHIYLKVEQTLLNTICTQDTIIRNKLGICLFHVISFHTFDCALQSTFYSISMATQGQVITCKGFLSFLSIHLNSISSHQ